MSLEESNSYKIIFHEDAPLVKLFLSRESHNLVLVENSSPVWSIADQREAPQQVQGEVQRLPFFHIGSSLWNGPEQSRARWFCAT
jgi:hypothetical protein